VCSRIGTPILALGPCDSSGLNESTGVSDRYDNGAIHNGRPAKSTSHCFGFSMSSTVRLILATVIPHGNNRMSHSFGFEDALDEYKRFGTDARTTRIPDATLSRAWRAFLAR
jgi:hypothetical protein